MQKIVLDTNVIVSSLIQRSFPYRIIFELFMENKFQICVSDELMTEYYEVLARPKFARFTDFFIRAESLLVTIENKAIKYAPRVKLNFISDIDDNMILELADESNADFIITGNTTDFTFDTYKNTKILSPKDFWYISQIE